MRSSQRLAESTTATSPHSFSVLISLIFSPQMISLSLSFLFLTRWQKSVLRCHTFAIFAFDARFSPGLNIRRIFLLECTCVQRDYRLIVSLGQSLNLGDVLKSLHLGQVVVVVDGREHPPDSQIGSQILARRYI